MDVDKSSKYTFKRLVPELYPDLVYISKSAFGIDPGIEYYSLKNETTNFGPSNLGFIAYSQENEPSAFYGVYSCPMIIDGEILLAAQSGDTMTHRNHTGKGLFITLAKMTYELAKASGIEFIFGFPNNNSYPGFVRKLEWVCQDKLKEYKIKILTIPLLKLAKKVKLFLPIYNWYFKMVVSLFSKEGKFFDSSVIQSGIGGVNRTEEFIKYKSFNGSFFRKLSNCSFWMKIDGFLFIGDIERLNALNYSIAINKLKKICFWAGIDTIIFQTSPNSFLDNKLSEFLNPLDAFFIGHLNLSNKYSPEKFKFVFGDVDTF